MRKFKVFFCLFIAVLMIVSAMTPVFAHSGRTDSNGGHWDHSTGTYHYHSGSSSNSSNSSGSSSSSSPKVPSPSTTSGCDSFMSILGSLIGAFMFLLIIAVIFIIVKSFLG